MNARLDPIIERFRFSHHSVAMMFALGMTIGEVSRKTGFTSRRLNMLLDDPTFSELIDHYRREGIERMRTAVPDAFEEMVRAHTTSLRQINDQLEEADEPGAEPIPLNMLVKINSEMGDRTGFSKHTSKTIHHDITFANALDRAIERSGKAEEVKQIEGVVLPLTDSHARPSVEKVSRPRTYRR